MPGPTGAVPAAVLLFLPAVLFASVALSGLRQPRYRGSAILLLLFWGMWATRDIVRPDTILASQADVVAIRWLDQHTAPDATFLVDVAPWFGVWRGADGGWWITPLTGRRTVLPPIAYAWSEANIMLSYTARAAALATLSNRPTPTYCPQLLTLMQEAAADYDYTRSPQPQRCPWLRLVYRGQEEIQLYQRLE